MAFDWNAFPTAAGAATPAAGGEGFDWNAHPVAEEAGPSEVESGLRGAAQGLTFGFGDELAGGGEALLDKLRGAHEALGELYVKHRDESRKNFKKAEEANPNAYGAGQLVGGIGGQAALALATGGASIPEQIALGAAGGALNAVGSANKLDDSTVKEAGVGALTGGAAGAVGAGLGKLASRGLNAVGSKVEQLAGQKVAQAEAAAADRGLTEAAAETASGRGSLGAQARETYSDLKDLLMLKKAGLLQGEQLSQFQELEDSGALKDLGEKLGANKIARLPGAKADLETAEESFKQLAGTEDARAKDIAEKMLSPKEALNQVASRVKRYVPRAAGALLGIPHGAEGVFGGMAGGQVLGPMRDALKRAAQHPATQKLLYGSIGKVGQALQANPAVLGRYGAVLGEAASRGPDALNAAHFVLAQTDPHYQEAIAQLQEHGPEEAQ